METMSEEFYELHKKGIISEVSKNYCAFISLYYDIYGQGVLTKKHRYPFIF
jgi:hypothetical protein